MQISRLPRVATVRFGLAVAMLAALSMAAAGAAEAAQSCHDLPQPQDMEVTSAAQIPDAYVARLNAGDAVRVTDLFADDAVHRGPDGVIRIGRAALLEFYEDVLANGSLDMAVGTSAAEGNRVAFELVSRQACDDADPATAVDVITVNDDGKIREFTVFYRPDGS